MTDPCSQYWQEAHAAIHAGLITRREAELIARCNTRKFGHWQRALHDLRGILGERRHDVQNRN